MLTVLNNENATIMNVELIDHRVIMVFQGCFKQFFNYFLYLKTTCSFICNICLIHFFRPIFGGNKARMPQTMEVRKPSITKSLKVHSYSQAMNYSCSLKLCNSNKIFVKRMICKLIIQIETEISLVLTEFFGTLFSILFYIFFKTHLLQS